ncbi:MAG: hypothetical protein HPY65_05385 [Syntrophaceae bacterium]|nr:hypothetical protein [Syntrophaceae bacterium]
MKRIGSLAAVAMVLALLCGCAAFAGKAGQIKADVEAARMFEADSCRADYAWYASGSHTYPNAIIGIRKDLKLVDDTLWRRLEMNPKTCRELVTGVQDRAREVGQMPYGFSILNDRGERIGIWYSILPARTGARMLDDKTVLLYTPDIDTYDRYEKDRGD